MAKPEDLYIDIDVNADSKQPELVDGVCILPRPGTTSGSINGRIQRCEIYVSSDGENYEIVATSDLWDSNVDWKEVKFDPVMATHVRIKAIETYGDGDQANKFASAAEIRITTPKLYDWNGDVTYNLASYKGTRLSEKWLAPKELADQIFVGWYENADRVTPCKDSRTDGDVYAKFVNREQALRLIGGSLKKTTDASVNTDLRFGYNIVLPESLGKVGKEGGMSMVLEMGN